MPRSPDFCRSANRSNRHVDAECRPCATVHRPQAQRADAHPRRRRMADRRQDLPGAGRSQGPYRGERRQIRPGLPHPCVRRDKCRAARARGQRTRDVRPAEAVLVHARLEQGARPAVSARIDAARFRRAPAAPQGAVGRVQVGADEILSGRSRPRHRRARRAVEGQSRRDAALSGDEAAHAGSRGGVLPRRRYRAGSRRDQPRLRRHGRRRCRADPPSPARHPDGRRRQRAQTHRRLFPPADPATARQSRRR